MKKVWIILFGVLTVAASSCRNNKKEAQALEELRMRQDSIRRADEQRILELQIKAREDSISLALASSSFESDPEQYSARYIVVGSFQYRDNANAYVRTMKSIFNDVQIIRKGNWNYVCVEGSFSTESSARAALKRVKSRLGGAGGAINEEEEEDDDDDEEDDADDDDEAADDAADSEDDDEEEEDDEEEDDSDSSPAEGGGQAWIHRVR